MERHPRVEAHAATARAAAQLPLAGLIAAKGKLYGTTWSGGSSGSGTAFALDPKNGAEAVIYSFCSEPYCSDRGSPEASLIERDDKLYGTTLLGGGGSYCEGSAGCGTVLKKDR